MQPVRGTIRVYTPPGVPVGGVKTHIAAVNRFPPYYDSLLAKVIVHGNHRQEALARMRQALDSFIIEGVRSEEHTSELQSQSNLVCRLLLEKKTKYTTLHKMLLFLSLYV